MTTLFNVKQVRPLCLYTVSVSMCVCSSDRLEAELEQKRQDAVMKELDKHKREQAAKAAAAAKASAEAALAANTSSHDMANICFA